MDKTCHLLIKTGNILKRCYLQHNNINKVLILDDSTGKVTLTIVPSETNAVVRFYTVDGETISDRISVSPNTSVRYKVTKNDFKPVEQTITVTDNLTIPVTLEEIFYKIDTEDYTYSLNNKVVTMTKYTGSATDIVSPNLEEDDE